MSDVKLTPAQWALLDRVCRSNGGGIRVKTWGHEWKVTQRLCEKGLIQGKLNTYETAVHTREGLQLWRSKQA